MVGIKEKAASIGRKGGGGREKMGRELGEWGELAKWGWEPRGKGCKSQENGEGTWEKRRRNQKKGGGNCERRGREPGRKGGGNQERRGENCKRRGREPEERGREPEEKGREL